MSGLFNIGVMEGECANRRPVKWFFRKKEL